MRLFGRIWLLALFVLLLLPFRYAQSPNATCIYFFYGEGCPHCGKIEPHISELQSRYDIELHVYEVYYNRENIALLESYFDAYNVPIRYRGVPVVFVGDTYIVGDTPILTGLEVVVSSGEYAGLPCPSVEVESPTGTVDYGTISGMEPEKVSLWVVTGAAIVDSINPCAIAVLLILLNALFAAGSRRRAFKAGFAFVTSIYIVYFLFGMGLFSAIQMSGLSYLFYQVVALMAIGIGILNVKDFLAYGKGGFVMEIPRSWRPALKCLLRSVTSPLGAFAMGFVVCLFELPCTGGPYLFILGLLAEKATQMMAIPILLYYNVIFVLPLVALTILFYAGMSTVEKAERWKERNIRLLHLVAGLIMLALGFWALMGFVF